jgi:hypothetical protein
MLFRPGAITLGAGRTLHVAYPLLPWFGVMAAGFGFGELLLGERGRRIRVTAALGLAMIVLFLALRGSNVYGDPTPWKPQDTGPKTVLSFVNCQKYPPSLLFILMTIGPGLVALAAFEATEDSLVGSTGPVRRAIETLGRVPLFFYVLQWPVIHILTNLVSVLSDRRIDWFVWSFDYPPGSGYSLPVIYVMWALVVAILYVAGGTPASNEGIATWCGRAFFDDTAGRRWCCHSPTHRWKTEGTTRPSRSRLSTRAP